MTYGFKIVQEMASGLSAWMDEKQYSSVEDFRGMAVPNVTDWQYLNLNYVTKAVIDQDACIKCGRCYAACEDTSHQAIAMSEDRTFSVKDDECVACNLCVNVCPVEGCITMVEMDAGAVDPRTKTKVSPRIRQLDDAPEQPVCASGRIRRAPILPEPAPAIAPGLFPMGHALSGGVIPFFVNSAFASSVLRRPSWPRLSRTARSFRNCMSE